MNRKRRVLDVVTAELIRNGLNSAALEMSNTLIRTAHNALLYEAKDFGMAIVSSEGRLWAEGAGGVPGFLGVLPDTIKSALARRGPAGFADGDVVIVNNPYLTGTHISDVTIYMPVFYDGDLIAFATSTAHWADIGGKAPGGWCPDSTDVYQEGICFSHQRLVLGGTPNLDLWSLIEDNVRYPSTVLGDLQAQIAACRQGSERICALCEKYGAETVRSSMAFVIAETEAAFRREVRNIPDGRYSTMARLDHDGVERDVHPEICLTLAVDDDQVRISFEGTSAATRGPVNDPPIGVKADLRATLKGLLMPHDPGNEGHFLAVEFDLPSGLIVSPERPAPCDCYAYIGLANINLAFEALSRAIPNRCPAGGYQIFGVYLYRVDPVHGRPFILIDPVEGGDGARPDGDGPQLIFGGSGNVSNTPIEVLEIRYPVRCERFELLPGVAGAGTHRGGLGVRRDYRVLEAGIYLQVMIENTLDPIARGIQGGRTGAPSTVIVWPGTEKETAITEKTSFFGPLDPGDLVSARSGGGGGWGPPSRRQREHIMSDLREEVITLEEAAAVYGLGPGEAPGRNLTR